MLLCKSRVMIALAVSTLSVAASQFAHGAVLADQMTCHFGNVLMADTYVRLLETRGRNPGFSDQRHFSATSLDGRYQGQAVFTDGKEDSIMMLIDRSSNDGLFAGGSHTLAKVENGFANLTYSTYERDSRGALVPMNLEVVCRATPAPQTSPQ